MQAIAPALTINEEISRFVLIILMDSPVIMSEILRTLQLMQA